MKRFKVEVDVVRHYDVFLEAEDAEDAEELIRELGPDSDFGDYDSTDEICTENENGDPLSVPVEIKYFDAEFNSIVATEVKR